MISKRDVNVAQGSNGMTVNGKHYASGSDVVLANEAVLQAGIFKCVFEIGPCKEWEESMHLETTVLDSFSINKFYSCSQSSQEDTFADDSNERPNQINNFFLNPS
mmetsp:Transcript_11212/g.22032  ORF Transcript_11212/g.22032 Transcript_11212/m.22032 type:complete len:105 (-) Transcript_11212:160-474(-)